MRQHSKISRPDTEHHLSSSSESYEGRARKRGLYLLLLTLALFLLALLALATGRYPSAGIHWFGSLLEDPIAVRIITEVRVPRVLSALIAGAVLSASGFVFQMLFSNPLVEPGFLGVSQAAAFGAALAIVTVGYQTVAIQLYSSLFAILALFFTFTLASRFRFGGWILRLILAGIAVSALFSSGLGMIKYTADPSSELQEITFWLLGGLWSADGATLISILPATLSTLVILFIFRWRINILSVDDRTAHTLGISPKFEKRLLLIVSTVGTATVISVTGLIGWIGLIVPHLARILFGSDSRFALPGSMGIGAVYLLLCDTLGRTLLTGEIPLGILTSALGTILFILLLTRGSSFGESL